MTSNTPKDMITYRFLCSITYECDGTWYEINEYFALDENVKAPRKDWIPFFTDYIRNSQGLANVIKTKTSQKPFKLGTIRILSGLWTRDNQHYLMLLPETIDCHLMPSIYA